VRITSLEPCTFWGTNLNCQTSQLASMMRHLGV
jgi:hypothetical protein